MQQLANPFRKTIKPESSIDIQPLLAEIPNGVGYTLKGELIFDEDPDFYLRPFDGLDKKYRLLQTIRGAAGVLRSKTIIKYGKDTLNGEDVHHVEAIDDPNMAWAQNCITYTAPTVVRFSPEEVDRQYRRIADQLQTHTQFSHDELIETAPQLLPEIRRQIEQSEPRAPLEIAAIGLYRIINGFSVDESQQLHEAVLTERRTRQHQTLF
jgi:hypothetical protein